MLGGDGNAVAKMSAARLEQFWQTMAMGAAAATAARDSLGGGSDDAMRVEWWR